VFLHNCVNVIWSFKGLEGCPLSILVTFLHKKISITLQRMQAFSILSWVVVASLATSWLSPLQHTPPITMTDLLHVVSYWDGEILTLVCANLTSCKFPFFFFLLKIPLYEFPIGNVFTNKVLQGSHTKRGTSWFGLFWTDWLNSLYLIIVD